MMIEGDGTQQQQIPKTFAEKEVEIKGRKTAPPSPNKIKWFGSVDVSFWVKKQKLSSIPHLENKNQSETTHVRWN